MSWDARRSVQMKMDLLWNQVTACLLAVLLTSATAALAQTVEEIGAEREEIEATLAGIVEDTTLDEQTRGTVTEQYQQALQQLDESAVFSQEADASRELLDKGAGKITELQKQVAELEASQENPPDLAPEELETPDVFLSQEDAKLVSLRTELDRLTDALKSSAADADAARQRLEEIIDELAGAREELSELDTETPAGRAKAVAVNARIRKLESEQEALRLGLESRLIRESLLGAEISLIQQQILRSTRRIARFNALIEERNLAQAETIDAFLDRMRQRSGELPPALEEPLKELEELATALRALSGETQRIERLQKHRERKLVNLREGLETFRKLIELDNLEGEFAQMFLQALRKLPPQRTLDDRLAAVSGQIATTRRNLYLLQDTEIIPRKQDVSDAVARDFEAIEDITREVKSQLETGYGRLIFLLTELETTERNFDLKAAEFRTFATEKLFWVRSSAPVTAESVRSIPVGMLYCYGPGNLLKIREALGKTPFVFHLLAALVILVLIAGRPRFRAILEESGKANRRLSTDRFSNTARALAMTLLLSLPLPLFALGLAIGIGWDDDPGKWITGLRDGLLHVVAYLFPIAVVIETCRNNGLGQLHFGWTNKQTGRTRKIALTSLLVYVPTVITLDLVLTEDSSQYLNGLGRLAALVLILGSGIMLAALLHPRHGLVAEIHAAQPDSRLGKTRKFWSPLIYTLTAAIAVLSLMGYILTSLMLFVQFGFVIAAISGAVFLHALILRWLSIQQRRLAFERAVSERQARHKAREAAETRPESAQGDESWIEEVREEEEFSLSRVNEHSRRLLRFVIGVALLWVLYLIWTRFAPVTRSLDELNLIGKLTLRELLLVVVVVTLTVSTVRNLPGLLEGLVLRRMNLTSGGRHTAITLVQYVVVGIGASFLFQNLGIDWSKFAWIAAALSVGIGFGLQEVVANFISGLILLFERPIRVGDVVTVDGIDGVVSKIQIRATTITGWDRKEFIVPNKNFVTGTLLNWTLSNQINRALIPVGVAYGSDTELALKLLLKTVAGHPNVLEDPAPIASFVGFGDSTLNLELRAYLPDLNERLNTISELHTAIDRAFKEAGIEIAFPQLDLHLKSKV